jgi:predicted fused transcriptional regulator/phosphomethylpyrimidine kinase
MITLSSKWATELASKPETGMGYQVVSVVLKDGKRFDQVAVVEGRITEIRGRTDIPFAEDDIAEIILTHDKWNFNAERK